MDLAGGRGAQPGGISDLPCSDVPITALGTSGCLCSLLPVVLQVMHILQGQENARIREILQQITPRETKPLVQGSWALCSPCQQPQPAEPREKSRVPDAPHPTITLGSRLICRIPSSRAPSTSSSHSPRCFQQPSSCFLSRTTRQELGEGRPRVLTGPGVTATACYRLRAAGESPPGHNSAPRPPQWGSGRQQGVYGLWSGLS